jgi:DNA topoisomerase-1
MTLESSNPVESAAQHLGNTPAVCRTAYVHPLVLNAYLEGSLEPEAGVSEIRPAHGLSDEEQCVLGLLQAA